MAVDRNRFFVYDAVFLIHLLLLLAIGAYAAVHLIPDLATHADDLGLLLGWFVLPGALTGGPLMLLVSLPYRRDWRLLAPTLVLCAALLLSMFASVGEYGQYAGAFVYVLIAGYTSLQWFFRRRWREWAAEAAP